MSHTFESLFIHVMCSIISDSIPCIPLSGVNFTFLYITFLYTLPVRLYHFNCLSEHDFLWIMGMINQIEIFPSSFGKENKKFSLTFFIWCPDMKPLYETLKAEL